MTAPEMSVRKKKKPLSSRVVEPPPRRFLSTLGPGLITGASDDDPSGIATYSQVGAQFGFGMLWTMLFSFPLMTAIQEICARIGRVTGEGLGANLRKHFPRWIVRALVLLVLAANILNLGADISAMGAALKLLIGGHAWVYTIIFALFSLILQILIPYKRYTAYLKWLAFSLLAYVATAFIVSIPWKEVARMTFIPKMSFDHDSVMALVAILGTTISPYLFFWQASAEVEEIRDAPRERALKKAPAQAPDQLGRIRVDTYAGMFVSNLIAYFIILTVAATLHKNGVTQIETAAQAAEALKPVAGQYAFLLFSLGIIGTGLLALPVLAGSAAYAASEVFRMRTGLGKKFNEARGFYAILGVSMIVGLAITFTSLDPIRALFLSAVFNGIVAAPVMIFILLLASRRAVMGKFMIPMPLRVTGWIAAGVMAAAALALMLPGK